MKINHQLFLKRQGMNLRITGPDDAPAIVLIHGSGCDGSLWDLLAGNLAPRMRVIAVDLPGHGASAPRGGGDTMKCYARSVAEAIGSLGLVKPAIGGHSLGGAVALTVVLENPELAGSLVLVGSGARLRVLPSIIEALASDFDMALASVGQFSFSTNAGPEIVRTAGEMMKRNGRDAMLADFLACNSFDVMSRLGEIRVSTLAVCGEADALTPPKYSRFLAEKIPGCIVKTIPAAGHMVMLEAPEALAEMISRFHVLI